MRNKAGSRHYNQPKTNKTEDEMIDLVDRVSAFEDFEANILPALKADVKSGMTPAELRKKYASLAQARVITAALTNPDDTKAVIAAQDIINRVEGKPTEKKEVTHTLANASDKELDAILNSEIEELEDMQERFEQ